MLKDINNLRKKYGNIKRNSEDLFLNLHPIQRGGVLTPEAQKALVDWGDGYSLCDNCLKGDIRLIKNPPVEDFIQDLNHFLDTDSILFTESCRRSKQIAFTGLKQMFPDRDVVIIDANAHYSTFLALEWNDLELREVPTNGYPEFKVDLKQYEKKIDEIEDETGNPPLAALLTHVDYSYGNYNNASVVGKICKKRDIPFILNGAYSIGTLHVKAKEIGADIVTASGHKSMAASGPIGVLGFRDEYDEIFTKKSKIKGDLTGRNFKSKLCYMLGCPGVYGAPLITLMASFPTIFERTQPDNVKVEGEKAEYFIENAIGKVEGMKLLGTRPKIHPLMNIETKSFEKVAKNHPRKGFFLREAFKKEGIIGMAPGISKKLEISTYGLTWDQIYYVTDVFIKICKEHGLKML